MKRHDVVTLQLKNLQLCLLMSLLENHPYLWKMLASSVNMHTDRALHHPKLYEKLAHHSRELMAVDALRTLRSTGMR